MSTTSFPHVPEHLEEALTHRWWAVALRGVCAILFGALALLAPGAVLLSLALFFGGWLLVDGVLGLVAAARGTGRRGLLIAEAVLTIAMGVLAIAFPVGAVLGFVLVTAAWALLTGGLMIAAAWRMRRPGRGWLAAGGVVSVIWGVLLAMAPLLGAVVLTWWAAGYAIAFGAALLVAAFRLRAKA
ncbi:DUF308 domain-containing protein [Siccirubricoccus sp. KC 17139]|uniref:DUF308 domain-containing protein n=1 Tax=Siccirubricoccus soli TaxID=2899147 RepID=A0ABT1D0P8_9PROT|nr:DUF308 domain-containing protein [Siccirubricoccus soli]MCO6415494.1 DUF308 domain-containing protein [Siccirubricoccus soli]MCP2681626.1 DUF308 domain-containing protein [Siccirubricoccus soli]